MKSRQVLIIETLFYISILEWALSFCWMILDKKWMTGLFLIVSSSYWNDPERVLEYRPLFWNTILLLLE